MAANKYTSELQVSQTAKSTSIAQLQLTDEVPQRSLDYLKQLAIVYNRQANEDKNTIALRTDKFIMIVCLRLIQNLARLKASYRTTNRRMALLNYK